MSESKTTEFRWNTKTRTAAFALAEGKTRMAAATEAVVSEATIYRWLREPEFSEEVDRLTLMIGIATRAQLAADTIGRVRLNGAGITP